MGPHFWSTCVQVLLRLFIRLLSCNKSGYLMVIMTTANQFTRWKYAQQNICVVWVVKHDLNIRHAWRWMLARSYFCVNSTSVAVDKSACILNSLWCSSMLCSILKRRCFIGERKRQSVLRHKTVQCQKVLFECNTCKYLPLDDCTSHWNTSVCRKSIKTYKLVLVKVFSSLFLLFYFFCNCKYLHKLEWGTWLSTHSFMHFTVKCKRRFQFQHCCGIWPCLQPTLPVVCKCLMFRS